MLDKKQVDRAKRQVKMIFETSNLDNAQCHIQALFHSKRIDIIESSLLHDYLDSLRRREEILG